MSGGEPKTTSVPASPVLFRDGQSVVVDLREPVFPDICIKSGKPANGNRFMFTGTCSNRQKTIAATDVASKALANASPILGAIGPLTELALSQQIQLDVGMQSEVRDRLLLRQHRGPIVCVASMAGMFLLLVGLSLSQNLDPFLFRIVLIVILALEVALFIAWCWSIFALFSVASLLHLTRVRGNFLWVEGVHQDFLCQLPQWKPEHHGPLKDWFKPSHA